MIRQTICILTLFFTLFTSAQAQKDNNNKKSKTEKKLESLKDSASYAMGISIGQTLSIRYPTMDIDLVVKGLTEAFATKDTLMPPEKISGIVLAFTKLQARAQSMENKLEGEKFLRENADRDSVVKRASGLQYIILRQGTGPIPVIGNRVKVHYRGTLINGKEFDNSYKRGQPAEFDITGVIKGWAEALQIMPAGSKYKLFIPSEMAYGESGMGVMVPPSSVLIFEVELLEVL